MHRLVASRMIGRDAELAAVGDAIAAASSGSGAVVAIVADAGTGKSRLARAATAIAVDLGATVAVGRCLEGSGEPYRPIAEALLTVDVAACLDDPAVRPFGAVLSRILPTIGPAHDVPAEAGGVVLAESLLRLLSTLGRGHGCLLVIEDLHWAAPETVALLGELAVGAARHGVAVVVTARPGVSDVDEALARVQHGVGGRLIRLEALDAHAIGALTEECLGGVAPHEVVAFVTDRSDGVPLFVEELLAGLADSGALVHDGERWAAVSRIVPVVPSSFAGSVRRRVEGLDPVARSVVDATAVLGREVDWQLLTATAALPREQIESGLRSAVGAQLVVIDGSRVAFRHALTRDAVLDIMLPPRREELARRALNVVDESSDPPGGRDLAIALATLCGDGERAATLLVLAARDALVRGALATAEEIADRADALRLDNDTRLLVDELTVDVLALAGKTIEAATRGVDALEALARRPGTVPRRIRLLLALARAEIAGGEWDAAHRHAGAARVLHDVEPDGELLARILAAEAHVAINQRRHGDALSAAEAALATAERAGVPDVACEALEVLGRIKRFTAPSEAADHFEQAVTVATAHGLGGWRLRALTELAIDEVFIRGRSEPLHEARAVAESMGALVTVAVIDLHLAGHALVTGDRDRGALYAERCAADCRRYRLSMLPIALLHVAAGLALAGDADGSEDAIAEALACSNGDPDVDAAAWGWVRGDLAYVNGDPDRWLDCLDHAMDILRGRDGTVPFPFRALWPLVRTIADRDGRRAVDEVRASHVMAVPHSAAALEVADAVALGRDGAGTDADRVASAAFDRMRTVNGGLWHLHRVRVTIATTCLRDGWGDPVAWLREADAYYRDLGYPRVAARCRRILREAGVPVPRRGRGDSVVPPDLQAIGVTSREMDVLHLVARRLTNREIGDLLHISARTVEKHIASLLLKTGASSRLDLADV